MPHIFNESGMQARTRARKRLAKAIRASHGPRVNFQAQAKHRVKKIKENSKDYPKDSRVGTKVAKGSCKGETFGNGRGGFTRNGVLAEQVTEITTGIFNWERRGRKAASSRNAFVHHDKCRQQGFFLLFLRFKDLRQVSTILLPSNESQQRPWVHPCETDQDLICAPLPMTCCAEARMWRGSR